ncbi:MAG TPA: hypothetical protein VK013_07105 [Myxococcaceae bacterium]|nr:hypothetical protein [Myxococcaceae bacterium]
MAKISQQPPAPLWPWGGPRSVRERLVDPKQLDRKSRKGDPKNPALASAALLEFLAPAHSSEEVRLPEPPPPPGGGGAPLEAFTSRPHLDSVSARDDERGHQELQGALSRLSASPDRIERLQGILAREAEMLSVVRALNDDVKAIISRMWWAQNEESY